MMKQWARLLLFVLVFFGCQNVERPNKPKNLISKEIMVEVLTEAYMANAARSVNNQAIIDKGIQMDTLIYGKFGIDSLQFVQSNAYYATDLNAYLEIFQKVESRLKAKQQKLDSIRQLDKNRKDSIANKQKIQEISAEPLRDSLI